MRFSATTAALSLLGLAAAVPTLQTREVDLGEGIKVDGASVDILGFTAGGSGCPQGTVHSMMSEDKKTVTTIFDQWSAEYGKDVSPNNNRKFCQMTLKVKYPQGVSFAIMKSDYRGYVQLDDGLNGNLKSTYYISGKRADITVTRDYKGPVDKTYEETDPVGVESVSWSPCGFEGMINIKTDISIGKAAGANPAPEAHGRMTVDSVDNNMKQIYSIQWKKC